MHNRSELQYKSLNAPKNAIKITPLIYESCEQKITNHVYMKYCMVNILPPFVNWVLHDLQNFTDHKNGGTCWQGDKEVYANFSIAFL